MFLLIPTLHVRGASVMTMIIWNENFSIGIPDLDKEHKYLIDIINQLSESMTANHSRDTLPEIIEQLYDYIGTHHSHEEALMQKSNYPNFPNHHQEHKNFHNNIIELHKLYATDLLYAKNLLNTLQDWVINHICNIDREL